MTAYFLGHKEDPSEMVKQAFHQIAEQDMQGLPFLHPHVEIKTYDFQVYEGQWVGVLLTPWMLNVVILPGPTQEWPTRKVSSKMAIQFPVGSIPFIVGDVKGVGQYLACSLTSPLNQSLTQADFDVMAQECMLELMTAPEEDANQPKQSRRYFMLKQEKPEAEK